jgi:hypothetical protein
MAAKQHPNMTNKLLTFKSYLLFCIQFKYVWKQDVQENIWLKKDEISK